MRLLKNFLFILSLPRKSSRSGSGFSLNLLAYRKFWKWILIRLSVSEKSTYECLILYSPRNTYNMYTTFKTCKTFFFRNKMKLILLMASRTAIRSEEKRKKRRPRSTSVKILRRRLTSNTRKRYNLYTAWTFKDDIIKRRNFFAYRYIKNRMGRNIAPYKERIKNLFVLGKTNDFMSTPFGITNLRKNNATHACERERPHVLIRHKGWRVGVQYRLHLETL